MISPATHLIQCDGLRDGAQCRAAEVIRVPAGKDLVTTLRTRLPQWRIGQIHALCPLCQTRGLRAALTLREAFPAPAPDSRDLRKHTAPGVAASSCEPAGAELSQQGGHA